MEISELISKLEEQERLGVTKVSFEVMRCYDFDDFESMDFIICNNNELIIMLWEGLNHDGCG